MSAALSAHHLVDLLGPLDGSGPAYRELTDRIRLLVVDGRVTDGTRLPSERELAAATGLSRTTTTRVYAELREAGLVVSRRGSGSVVSLPFTASGASSLIITPDDDETIALTYSAPAGPPGMVRAFEAATARLPGLLATTGYLPDGLPALRELLAQRYTDRGLPTSPDQVVVTSGAMGAISLLAHTVLSPGRRAVVEAVSYPHAHEALAARGARLSALPCGDRPWDARALARLLAGTRHHAAYLVPEFHNPTGAVMTADEREAFAHLLRRHEVVPLVDESLREVNLDGIELPPSYASFDEGALVVGSSSKAYWGGLRVGWIRAPRHLVMPIVQHRMADDLGSSAFDQLVLTELLTDGGGTAAAGLAFLRAGRDHLLAELARELPQVRAPRPAGGLNLWARLPAPLSTRLVAAAARHGLLLTPGPRFVTGAVAVGERHLRLPFTQPEDVMTRAVRRLRLAWEEVTGAAGATTGTSRADGTLDLIA